MAMRRQQVSAEKGETLLDVLVIIGVSFTIVLLILWINAQYEGKDTFNQLPVWLSKAISNVWSFVTAAGASSALIYILKKRSQANQSIGSYMLWIFGTTFSIFLAIWVVKRVYEIPDHHAAKDFQVRFQVTFTPPIDGPELPNLTYVQTEPKPRDAGTVYSPVSLAPQKDKWYQEWIALPDQGRKYVASFKRAIKTSELSSDAVSKGTELCLVKGTKKPKKNDPEALLRCAENGRCQNHENDPGWVEPCSENRSPETNHSGWFPMAYADEATIEKRPGWRVPSIETLSSQTKRQEREEVGYTEFAIASEPLKEFSTAEYFTYAISVNGTAVFIDGWPPEYLKVSYEASKGVSLKFGLENLDFSGAKSGVEEIDVQLNFYQKDNIIKQVKLPLRYVALRPSKLQKVVTDGLAFEWSGKYISSKNENKFEVFIISTKDVQKVEQVRNRLNNHKLRYANQDVIGVIRPPLENYPWYGIVLGLRQETGQIKFTFNERDTSRLCDWALQNGKSDKLKSLIKPDAYRYEIEFATSKLCKDLKVES